MYSQMNESELEKFIDGKIREGLIDPDFFTCMFLERGIATIYDALEAPGERLTRKPVKNTEETLKKFEEFDCNGYVIFSPEIQGEVASKKGEEEYISIYLQIDNRDLN